MTEQKSVADGDIVVPVPDAIASGAHIDAAGYAEKYAASVADPEGFWGAEGKALDWIKPFTKVKDTSFAHDDVHIRWFEDGTLNVCANCVDRHLETRGDQTAIIFEPDDPEEPASTSPTRRCTARSARWPTSSRPSGCARATGWCSTCR